MLVGGGREGGGCTPGEGAGDGEGTHRCDALDMGTCAAAGSFAQLNNLILWTQCVIEG